MVTCPGTSVVLGRVELGAEVVGATVEPTVTDVVVSPANSLPGSSESPPETMNPMITPRRMTTTTARAMMTMFLLFGVVVSAPVAPESSPLIVTRPPLRSRPSGAI
jgi:hypothetical protein